MKLEQQPTGPETGCGGEQAPNDGPKIYVASLSDYNAGILHGTWLDAARDVEDLQAGVDAMLEKSPTTARTGERAEEAAIHDYEGFGSHVGLSEYEPLARISALAQGIEAHGLAYGAWWEVCLDGQTREPVEGTSFEDDFIGEFSSLEECGADLLDSMGIAVDDLPGVPEEFRPYVSVDAAAYARDLELSGSILATETNGGLYVFWNN